MAFSVAPIGRNNYVFIYTEDQYVTYQTVNRSRTYTAMYGGQKSEQQLI